MDAALNQSGVLVRAAKASYSGAFRCPVCRVSVIFASGPRQSPHFRHHARTPIEDRRIHRCPNYVADQGGNAVQTYRGRLAPPPAPPQPRLAVAWVRSGHASQCWGLMVTVPVPPVPVVHVVIDDNVNGAVLIRRELVVRKRQFFVRASPRQYQVVGYESD
jgi:hypothetical protein